jgi:hypothetical protein
MSDAATFGRAAAAVRDAGELLALEGRVDANTRFADIDDLIGDLVVRSLTGQRIVTVQRGRQNDTITVDGLTATRSDVLADRYVVANQHARGAWFVPEKGSLKAGVMNFPATFAAQPRFAGGIIWEERARVLLGQNPDAVLSWAVLEPLFEELFLPFELRGRLVGTKSQEDQLAAWTTVDALLASLELEFADELAVMRYGGGWSRLRSAEQLEAKQRLLAALASEATPALAARYRAHRLLRLITRYYAKAKDGRARRKQVLTRPLEKTLSGFFGGDWLAFLDLLGEEPHPDEEIAVAIPETKLMVGGTKTVATVAAEKGLPAEEVERMLATFWETSAQQGAGVTSPVEERVAALEHFWHPFDELHGRQTSGMRSLWGLVEDMREIRIGWEGPEWYHARQYADLLPATLSRDIERLWGSIMLPRWPDRVVSEIAPHALMAEAFGPALHFWHGTALTAWFLCEGPYSRTDMIGLATYHQDALAALQRLGCPIDAGLFAELQEAEQHLGPPEPITNDRSTHEVVPGISIEFSTSMGSRRSGFERLRDIITRHRRAWAERYLGAYLRARWETELREAARLHAQAIAERGKPPTAKQFARHAATPVNHWFGGDIEGFYAAVGEKSPVHPQRVMLMPQDRRAFALAVFERLGGKPFHRETIVASHEEGQAQAEEQDRITKLGWLAGQSLHLIQLAEALGRPPTMKEFGAPSFEYRSAVIAPDVEAAWNRYAALIETVRREPAKWSHAEPAATPNPLVGLLDSRADQPPSRSPDSGSAEGRDRPSWLHRLRRC